MRIGGVILFFGLAFLVKYAASAGMISIELRLISVALLGIGLLILGWRLREREGHYGTILQGLGVAIFYLVVYTAAKLYLLLSLKLAFVLMLAIVIVGSLLAVMQDALPLALFAISGGFIAPILTSSGEGSHIVLFSYYALLNSGVVAIAWYRSWRTLNYVGFVFTFIIGTAWGVLRYEPEMFWSTQPFLILFFLFFLAISILFTLKKHYTSYGFVDGTLVFELPLVAFALQISLVEEMKYGVLISAIVVGAIYLSLAKYLFRYPNMKLLAEVLIYFDREWKLQSMLHPLGMWLFILIMSRELYYQITLLTTNTMWKMASIIVIALTFAYWLTLFKRPLPNFLKQYQKSYRFYGVGGILSMMLLWLLYSFGMAGNLYPFPYLMLLNPIDLLELLTLGIILYWLYHHQDHFPHTFNLSMLILGALMILITTSVIFARSLHHYRLIDYHFTALWSDLFFQAGLSILWSLIAIIVMLLGKRFLHRSLWIAGFSILMIVIVKLFFIELGNRGTIERIISFIGVGGLLLLIGYFAPLPPKQEEAQKED